MAERLLREEYKNVIIDCDDMTITEVFDDKCVTYSIIDILRRWDNIDGITLIIARKSDIHDVIQDKAMGVNDESKI